MAAAPIVFFDIAGPDLEKQRAFFRDVFEWESAPTGHVSAPVLAGGQLGGFLRTDPADVLLYFGVLLTWRGVGLRYDGASLAEAVQGTVGVMPLALLALGMLATLAWLMASTTAYTLTNRRVVMRVGVVLSVTFNLPFARIAAADLQAAPRRLLARPSGRSAHHGRR